MTLCLDISEKALADVGEVWDYIAEDDIDAADQFIERLYVEFDMLARHPRAGRERPDLQPGLRTFPIGRYVVVYRERAERVEVVRVLSAYRDLGAIF